MYHVADRIYGLLAPWLGTTGPGGVLNLSVSYLVPCVVVLGVVMGYDSLPAHLKEGIPAIENEKFSYTNHSFNSIVEATKSGCPEKQLLLPVPFE